TDEGVGRTGACRIAVVPVGALEFLGACRGAGPAADVGQLLVAIDVAAGGTGPAAGGDGGAGGGRDLVHRADALRRHGRGLDDLRDRAERGERAAPGQREASDRKPRAMTARL